MHEMDGVKINSGKDFQRGLQEPVDIRRPGESLEEGALMLAAQWNHLGNLKNLGDCLFYPEFLI